MLMLNWFPKPRLASLAALLGPPVFGACLAPQPPSGNLVQQLQLAYTPTVMEVNGLKVSQPGCVLVIRLEGVVGYPGGSKLGFADNVYEDGEVKNGTRGKLLGGLSKTRILAVGEKVYLLKTDIKENGIVFNVQSCGACDPAAADPAHKPYRAAIDVRFQKGFLTVTDLAHVEQVVGEILALPDGPPAGSAAPVGAAEPAQQFAPIAPPPPPPAQQAQPASSAAISVGQSADQVKAAFGEPVTKAKAGGTKEIWVYKNLKVTFANGKVSDVE